jgi:signal transduction histidine kinase
VVTLALVACALTCSIASAQPESHKTVLTIHSGTEDFVTNPVLDAGIRETLGSRPDLAIDYFAEYLESDRFGASEASTALAEYIGRKYRGKRIDVVIAITHLSLRFALDHRAELFADAPIVSVALDAPDESVRRAGPGIAALTVGIAHAQTLNLALALHPSTEQVFVIANSENPQNEESVRAELSGLSRRVRLSYIEETTLPRLLDAVKAIPARSLLFYIWQSVLVPGHVLYSNEVLRLVADATPVPVYGSSEFYMGHGVVGGVMRGTRETGIRAAEMALQILDGTRAQNMPVEDARLVPIVDWRQLRRWGIDPATLPPGSDIRFRTPTAWESYRGYIIATALVLAAQLMLIAGLLVQRHRRQRAEETIRRREATLRTSYERIRQLTGRLINAQEAARAGLARDLHDDVCQQLVFVSIAVSNLKGSSGEIQDRETQEAFADLEQQTQGMFNGIRRLSHDLHPASLRLLGLGPALRTHCGEVAKRYDVEVSFETEGELGQLHQDVAVCLFRIAQESIRNGVVHGGARRFGVSLARSNDHVELTVSDDGHGFDLEVACRDGSGLGLVSMEERARVVGGDVQITTGFKKGTTIRVRCPAELPQSGQLASVSRSDSPEVVGHA